MGGVMRRRPQLVSPLSSTTAWSMYAAPPLPGGRLRAEPASKKRTPFHAAEFIIPRWHPSHPQVPAAGRRWLSSHRGHQGPRLPAQAGSDYLGSDRPLLYTRLCSDDARPGREISWGHETLHLSVFRLEERRSGGDLLTLYQGCARHHQQGPLPEGHPLREDESHCSGFHASRFEQPGQRNHLQPGGNGARSEGSRNDQSASARIRSTARGLAPGGAGRGRVRNRGYSTDIPRHCERRGMVSGLVPIGRSLDERRSRRRDRVAYSHDGWLQGSGDARRRRAAAHAQSYGWLASGWRTHRVCSLWEVGFDKPEQVVLLLRLESGTAQRSVWRRSLPRSTSMARMSPDGVSLAGAARSPRSALAIRGTAHG